MTREVAGRSGSLAAPTYWWYVARERLFESVFGRRVAAGARILEVGSADGPSVRWLRDRGWCVATDIDLGALGSGGVCASVTGLPFRDGGFDAVAAFDVVEHVEDDLAALRELRRVVCPGGQVLLSVPAYRWAWSQLDELAGHHHRYTRRDLADRVLQAGFEVQRVTHAFAAVFPFFIMDRLRARLTGAPPERPASSRTSRRMQRLLLALTAMDVWWLKRRDLAFGSSIMLVARRPLHR